MHVRDTAVLHTRTHSLTPLGLTVCHQVSRATVLNDDVRQARLEFIDALLPPAPPPRPAPADASDDSADDSADASADEGGGAGGGAMVARARAVLQARRLVLARLDELAAQERFLRGACTAIAHDSAAQLTTLAADVCPVCVGLSVCVHVCRDPVCACVLHDSLCVHMFSCDVSVHMRV